MEVEMERHPVRQWMCGLRDGRDRVGSRRDCTGKSKGGYVEFAFIDGTEVVGRACVVAVKARYEMRRRRE